MVQTTEKLASTASERYLLIYAVSVIFIVTALVVVFFVMFLKRKNKILLEKIEQEQAFEAEIVQAQTETQEQTLKNIGWELHDNIGQLLSFAHMQLSILKMQVDDNVKTKFKDTSDALKESLAEVRALSKTLNNEVVLNQGFEKSILNELNRLKKMKFNSAEMEILGNQTEFANRKHEIIIFRIIQEFLSNSVKYSEAKNIKVILNYQSKNLVVILKDDGKGFDMEKAEKGSGLINMKSRAKLINADFDLQSKEGGGVKLIINYPII
ncbi:sensor histidine kinase [Aestuariibaculum sediminum]|uniref:histidine kinase n=1 Tax=Aestuariibaculum sediminum TaxID=2770637 RepID=A0A8J6Q6D6_9FLAO|nr:histidine kinase [Aestuariibaculum sediminum]MBD0831723.1 histidine kinase [Aestuariibaculum sediminum]